MFSEAIHDDRTTRLLPASPPPPAPMSIEETGLEPMFLRRLLAKYVIEQDMVTATFLSGRMKLPKMLINVLIKDMVQLGFLEARGLSADDVKSDIRYSLSTRGIDFAFESISISRYAGPAPVSLDAFCKQVAVQSVQDEHILRDEMLSSLKGLVLSENLVDELGPAISSGRSILLYGPPGNGKTSIAERVAQLFKRSIWIPYAIEISGHVINFFDEAVHEQVSTRQDGAPRMDMRWVECRRPVIKTGGELTLRMLDLIYNESSNLYEAPVHLKATGGVFIIDDFGRQHVAPQSLINRWIIPLERGFDYLTLHTGKKFRIPFDELVIFSTNFLPNELTDEAGLRRFQYKIHVGHPTKEEYLKIFENYAKSKNVQIDMNKIMAFYDSRYVDGLKPSAYHPKSIIDYIDAFCRYNSTERVATDRLLDNAWRSIFAL